MKGQYLYLNEQSGEIIFLFLTFIHRPEPEQELLLVLKFFRGTHDFRSKTAFFARLRRNPFGKIISLIIVTNLLAAFHAFETF